MDCLKGCYGMRQACAGGATPAPRFSMYIEDYPGLTRAALQAIEPGVWLNCQAFLDDMTRAAWTTIVEVDAKAALEEYIRTREELEFGLLGEFDEEPTYADGVAQPRGLVIEKNAGIMGMLSVGRVWIWSENTVTVTVTVTDGTNPATFEDVELIAGEAVGVIVHYETAKDRVTITINDVAFKPASGTTEKTAKYSTCEGCTGRYRFQTLTASGILDGEKTEDLQGITVEGGLTCSLEPAICVIAPKLKVPMFYALVMKILEHWDATPRMNLFAQHKAEWVKEQLAWLREFRYPQAWELHSKGLAAHVHNLDRLCVDCGTGVRAGYAHP